MFEEIITLLKSEQVQAYLFPTKVLFILVSLIFISLIIYFYRKQAFYLDFEKRKITDFFGFKDFQVRRKSIKTWQKIDSLMKEENPASLKLALIEADSLLYSTLQKLGYQAKNLKETLDEIDISAIPNIDSMKKMAEIRNNLVQNSEYNLTEQEAKELIESCHDTLKKLGCF